MLGGKSFNEADVFFFDLMLNVLFKEVLSDLKCQYNCENSSSSFMQVLIITSLASVIASHLFRWHAFSFSFLHRSRSGDVTNPNL